MSKRHSNRNKYLFIGLFFLLVVTIVAAVALYNDTPRQKPAATEYLKVWHTRSIGEFSNQNKSVLITTLGLRLTAIGGDAHDILIVVESQPTPENDMITFLANGSSSDAVILLNGLPTTLNDQGKFPVEFQIGCAESEYETVTVYIDPKDISRV